MQVFTVVQNFHNKSMLVRYTFFIISQLWMCLSIHRIWNQTFIHYAWHGQLKLSPKWTKSLADFLPARYSLSRHWLLVVLAACPSVGLPYNCHLLFSSCQYQCHLVLKTWPAAATTDDTVDSRWILGDVQFTADRERNISSLFIVL